MSTRSPITTHILDTSRGKPAAQVPVRLEVLKGETWHELKRAATNADGRVEELLPSGSKAEPGVYRMHFDVSAYYRARGEKGFYPFVEIVFEITNPQEHHHVPLLLNPYGYSTYRGS